MALNILSKLKIRQYGGNFASGARLLIGRDG